MKNNSKKIRKKSPPPHPAHDLFGEVPVLERDIHAWVAVIAPRWYGSRRMDYYVRDWDVAGKIRQAKLSGRFDQVKTDAENLARCGECINRFYQGLGYRQA